ncbi:hypothetical protein C2845_PM05G18450 [Panicum miliaceum]|uniref:Protein FAR1-RELATED SEQUENCE n=1 Tax=Panicum miliaceum TaxID=4540 RepID=A0A3L6T015_PANMI|nr:hypothetical protein C2845_PM05G18450 [Panicum miliaceum]
MESQQVRDQALPSIHGVSGGQQVPSSNSAPPAAATLQAESGGVIVPTADTATDAVDVEDGVEVLSTPQEPFVGMSFNISDAARDYYNSYAQHTGFSIRIDTSRESKRAGEKTKYIYVFQKAGVNKKEKVADDGPITEKKIVRQRCGDYVVRTHCPTRMIVRKIAPGQWDVVNFEKEHNHDRLRKFSLTKYMKSHRDIPAEEKEFIKLLHGCCITTTRAYQIMAELYGGIENCPYTEGDAKNLRVEYHVEYKENDVELTADFKDCIDNSFTPEEFEHKWQLFLDKYEINDDERFQHLYDMRHFWVPVYFMHRFFPFLQTTARSEGFNAVLKRYVNPKNSILNFVQQYKKIQQRIFSKQDQQEANTAAKVPHYLTRHPMERQMKKAYTRKLFNVFQHELQLSSSYYVVHVEGDELIDVVPYKRCPDPLYGTRTFRVTVFDALAVHEVPSQYILPRWSVEPEVEDGVEVATEPLQEAQITSHGKHVVHYCRICTNFNKIVRPFMADDEAYGIVSKQVGTLQTKLATLRKQRPSSVLSRVEYEHVDLDQPMATRPQKKARKKASSSAANGGDPNVSQQPSSSHGLGAEIGDPPITKKQGCPMSKRYKTGLGLVPPKKSPCSYCGSAEHTTAACSSKPARKHTKELVDRPLKEAAAA